MLVVKFITCDKVILLSENIRNNPDGLRRILNDIVAPALVLRAERLCLTALFKKGKTSVDDYCLAVSGFLEKARIKIQAMLRFCSSRTIVIAAARPLSQTGSDPSCGTDPAR